MLIFHKLSLVKRIYKIFLIRNVKSEFSIFFFRNTWCRETKKEARDHLFLTRQLRRLSIPCVKIVGSLQLCILVPDPRLPIGVFIEFFSEKLRDRKVFGIWQPPATTTSRKDEVHRFLNDIIASWQDMDIQKLPQSLHKYVYRPKFRLFMKIDKF